MELRCTWAVAMNVRPNFFIAIRLACPVFADAVVTIQDQAIQRAPHLSKCRMQRSKLHMTGFVFAVEGTEHINRAVACLESFQDDLNVIMSSVERKEVRFNTINNFTTKVLYASPDEDEVVSKLAILIAQLEERFVTQGIFTEAQQVKPVWQPHATILKTSYDRRNGRKLKIQRQDYEGLDIYLQSPTGTTYALCDDDLTTQFREESGLNGISSANALVMDGEPVGAGGGTPHGICVPLTTIDLLSMQEVQADGYYRSYAKIFF